MCSYVSAATAAMSSSGLPHQVGEASPLIEQRLARPVLVQQLAKVCCLLFVMVVAILSIAQQLTHDSSQEPRTNLDELQPDGNLDGPDASSNNASDSCHTMAQAVMVGCGVVVGTAIAVPAAIAIAGFSAGGVVAGSAASAWQATIGVVAAGSLFAWLQAAGATGAVAAAAAVSAGVSAAAGYATHVISKQICS
jgi:Interferon-induced 6-16 family